MQSLYAVGLMSGTSMDGIDAALVRIDRDDKGKSAIEYIDFYYEEYPSKVRARLLEVADGAPTDSRELVLLSDLLGRLYTDAVSKLMTNNPDIKLDFIGTHGQTIYHSLEAEEYLGFDVQSSLQIGEPSYLAEAFSCPVVSDFRVRDIAAGGLGAPLVPFVEYDLYASEEDIVFLNIGGISNISFISQDPNEIIGFDTGPGNMLIDQAIVDITNGEKTYDDSGNFSSRGKTSEELLEFALSNPYYSQEPPKNSGRENFGHERYLELKERAAELNLSDEDFVRTITDLTARINADAIRNYCPRIPAKLIVSGGGSHNKTIIAGLKEELPEVEVELGEVLQYPNDAKEAIAFAYLAYKTIMEESNNITAVTGAKHPVVMGKISL